MLFLNTRSNKFEMLLCKEQYHSDNSELQLEFEYYCNDEIDPIGCMVVDETTNEILATCRLYKVHEKEGVDSFKSLMLCLNLPEKGCNKVFTYMLNQIKGITRDDLYLDVYARDIEFLNLCIVRGFRLLNYRSSKKEHSYELLYKRVKK